MRVTRTRNGLGRLLAVLVIVFLAAACTNDDSDVRSPAPTGSLTPATSAEAPASP